MVHNQTGQTATIYQFPVGGRAALGWRATTRPLAEPVGPSVDIVSTDSWYHDAAIRVLDGTTKR